jgi:hypothetical protein
MGNSEQRATGGTIETAGSEAHPPDPYRVDATERLTIELARLRAKFGADPAIARASLDDAWMSPTAAMEEDEAEFIDAVADCLGVGLSLDAALTCWDSGGLLYDDQADGELDEVDDDGERPLAAVTAHHHPHGGGRRHLVP